MKTFRVTSTCDPGRLHTELEAAGVKVITVRGKHVDGTRPAYCALVITKDAATKAQVDAVIQKHVESGDPGKTITKAMRDDAFRRWEEKS